MSDLNQAADDIRNFLRPYKNYERVLAALESLASYDQAKAEKEKILAEMDADIAARKDNAAKAQGDVIAAREEAAQIVAKARSLADTLIAGAQEAITLARNDTEVMLAKLNSEAQSSAATMIAGAKEMAAQFRSEADLLYAKGQEIQGQITAQEAELARLTDAIAAARATMAQIMGK